MLSRRSHTSLNTHTSPCMPPQDLARACSFPPARRGPVPTGARRCLLLLLAALVLFPLGAAIPVRSVHAAEGEEPGEVGMSDVGADVCAAPYDSIAPCDDPVGELGRYRALLADSTSCPTSAITGDKGLFGENDGQTVLAQNVAQEENFCKAPEPEAYCHATATLWAYGSQSSAAKAPLYTSVTFVTALYHFTCSKPADVTYYSELYQGNAIRDSYKAVCRRATVCGYPDFQPITVADSQAHGIDLAGTWHAVFDGVQVQAVDRTPLTVIITNDHFTCQQKGHANPAQRLYDCQRVTASSLPS